MATLSEEELQGMEGNPFAVAEAVLQDSLALLFSQPPEERDPHSYVDLDFGTDREGLLKEEALTIRTMAQDGMHPGLIAEIVGVTKETAEGVISGDFFPCVGGVLKPDNNTGLRIPATHPTLDQMTAAVLNEAMNVLPSDLFELLCHQNGYEIDKAFESLNLLESRNDEEDRAIYRSFLRRVSQTKKPGDASRNRKRGRKPRGGA
jgi:hypothetical protein